MDVGILTVGDEVLAGDIPNTNAHWLASQLTDRGATVGRILTIPDEAGLISSTVTSWIETFDAIIVTGGLGGTHDDVTGEGIAAAFDRELVVDDAVYEDVLRTIAEYRGLDPATVTAADIDFDIAAWAALPEGSRVLYNPEGLCPGFVLRGVYAFPGVPDEMQALFDQVADEFAGETVTRTVFTPLPEASMADVLSEARDRFGVMVGSYPATDQDNRVKITGEDPEEVRRTAEWLLDRIEGSEG